LARRIFGLGVRRADRTGATGRGMETDAHHWITRDIPAWRPSDAGVSLGTAGVLRLPIDHEGTQIIVLACPPLVVYSECGGNSERLQTRYDQPMDYLSGGADDAIQPGLVFVCTHPCHTSVFPAPLELPWRLAAGTASAMDVETGETKGFCRKF
jgi:hypothetical protein